MPVREMFEKAFRRIGGNALLLGENGERKEFMASIQPVFSGSGGEVFSRIGAGGTERCKLYTPYDGVTVSIHAGGSIAYRGYAYIVEKIEDMCYLGEACFREGIIRKRSPEHYTEDL